jgi:oxygen-independent coproporphyrinogen-3 oxidase
MSFNRLYIHVPFCESKCAYCAFYSETNASEDLILAYFRRLEEEFMENSEECAELDSIFIGGGTPNLLSAANLAELFRLISANFAISSSTEISIECNPELMTPEKAEIIAKFANRVSVGIQSFSCEFRRIIGRRGNVETVFRCIEILKNAGIKNIGCDLIYSIPNQSTDQWRDELEKAVTLGVKHISAYSLTYEEGTHLSAKYADSVNPEKAAEIESEMWELAGTTLKNANIARYEVSNYAVPGFECRHNLEIWYGDTYLGCGPAAASFDGTERYTNPSDLQKWLDGVPPERDIISKKERASEILVMGLRTSQGWNIAKFAQRTGFTIETWSDKISELMQSNLIQRTEDSIKLKPKGLLLWDSVAEEILI